MVVTLTRPSKGAAGQSWGQDALLSPAPQIPSPQREDWDSPGVALAVVGFTEQAWKLARQKIAVTLRIQNRRI
jgi:hypothetical protein